jgi:hypothetical protein
MSTRTTADAFSECDENLKLDPHQRSEAEKLHNEITDLLRKAGIIIYAFLQGSFARRTMIAPLRDVDKVVVLARRMFGLTPDQVMDEIQAILALAYSQATFERTRHSLKVDFGAESFYFDTVPAWETDTDDDDVCIANRETGGWDRSNTRELIRVVSERNQETNGLLIHQVRMGKQAVRHLLDGCVPGLHVESWAYLEITRAMSHDEAVARTLSAGARLLGHAYFDPTGVDLISAKLKPDIIMRAKPVLERAASDAARALQLAAEGRYEAAIAIWHSILGDDFPAASSGDVSALRASFLGAGVSTTGRVTPFNAPRLQPTRAWGEA